MAAAIPEIVLKGRELQEAYETEKQTRLRRRAENALFEGAVVLGFGALGYFGFWLYEAFENMNTQIQIALGEITPTRAGSVHPFLKTEEALNVMIPIWERELGWLGAQWPIKSFQTLQGNIHEDGSLDPLYTRDYNFLKATEKRLIDEGYIEREEVENVGVHPFDRVKGFVLRDKRYWAGVMALTALPGGLVLKDLISKYIERLKELKK